MRRNSASAQEETVDRVVGLVFARVGQAFQEVAEGFLVGVQVPKADKKAFRDFLEGLAYPCEDETDNPVYRLFLR